MFQLVRLDTNEVIQLGSTSVSIGRKAKMSQVVIDESSISGLHCRIVMSGGDKLGERAAVTVYDLGSRNGTWVNGQRVASAKLSENDELQLGRLQMTFHRDLDEVVISTIDEKVVQTARVADPAKDRRDESLKGATALKKRRTTIASPAVIQFASIENEEKDEVGHQVEESDRGTGVMIEVNMSGAVIGPFTVAALADSVAKNEIKKNAPVRVTGAKAWTTATSLLRVLDPEGRAGTSVFERPMPMPQAPMQTPAPVMSDPVVEPDVPPFTATTAWGPVKAPTTSSHVAKPEALKTATSTSSNTKKKTSNAAPAFNLSRRMMGSIAATLMVGILSFAASSMGGDSSGRVALMGTIIGAGKAGGRICFQPETGQKGPVANATILNGQYAFNSSNGPMPGTYDVVIELVDKPADSSSGPAQSGKMAVPNGQTSGFFMAPPRIGKAHVSVASSGSRELNITFTEETPLVAAK